MRQKQTSYASAGDEIDRNEKNAIAEKNREGKVCGGDYVIGIVNKMPLGQTYQAEQNAMNKIN